MTLPAAVDVQDARQRAHELRRDVIAGERAAIDRALTAHPKYVGGGAERLRHERFRLRDAQATLANEMGYASWRELVATADRAAEIQRAEPWSRYARSHLHRAIEESTQRGHSWVGPDHLLLAILNAPAPTTASQVLGELGITYEGVSARAPRADSDDPPGRGTSPAYHQVVARASALSVAEGAEFVNDEHVLLALLYDEHRDTGSAITNADGDPDEIYVALEQRGVVVPPVRPPVPDASWGPATTYVYFPESDEPAVRQALRERHRGAFIVFRASRSRAGYWYVWGEDHLGLGTTIRDVVADASLVEALHHSDVDEVGAG